MNERNENSAKYDLTNFTIREMTECGKAIRGMSRGASSMEDVACRVSRYLYDTLTDGGSGLRACSMVRLFKTHDFEKLDNKLKSFASCMLGETSMTPSMKCLTLLGTAGEAVDWNTRRLSKGHQAIPLPSEKTVEEIPMMRNLIKQLGMSVRSVVNPDPKLLLDMEQKTYNVFLVPEALGSPYIPAQKDFVVPYGIKSVMGFGGMLPTGDIFVIIMFVKVPITRGTADIFKNLAMNIKLAILPFEDNVFSRT